MKQSVSDTGRQGLREKSGIVPAILSKTGPWVLFTAVVFMMTGLVILFSLRSMLKDNLSASADNTLRVIEIQTNMTMSVAEALLSSSVFSVRDMLTRRNSADVDEIRDFITTKYRHFRQGGEGIADIADLYAFINGTYISGSGWIPPADFDPASMPWYIEALRLPGHMGLTSSYKSARSGERVVSLSRWIYDDNGKSLGVIAMDLSVAQLGEYMSSLRLAEGGYGVLLDKSFKILFHPDERYLNKYLGDVSEDYLPLIEALRNASPGTGGDTIFEHTRNVDGTESVSFFRQIYKQWYAGLVTPSSGYYKELNFLQAVIVALLLVCALLFCYAVYRLGAAGMRSENESRAKSSFMATVSHEIRTPLNVIIGLAEIHLQRKQDKETHAGLSKILNAGTSLVHLVNDILDISKIEGGGGFDLVPTEYDTADMINDAVLLNVVRMGSKDIFFNLKVDDTLPARLFGDEKRVLQILNNLLSNAFKYTEQGLITFRVGWKEQDEKTAILTFDVGDTGRGIREEDMKNLFTPYSKFDIHANRKIEGIGLGLTITKKLVEMMGGSISMQSKYGEGTVASAVIRQRIITKTPMGREVVEELKNFRRDSSAAQKYMLKRSPMPYGKVLVVDDIKSNLEVAKGLLRPYGLRVDTADGGAEAVGLIEKAETRYDLVFMDHMMPGMDGVEAVRRIRRIGTEYARTLPVVALTANAMSGNQNIFLKSGFNGYISKPIDLHRLDSILNEWIRDKQNEEALLLAEEQHADESANRGLFAGKSVPGVDLATGVNNYGDEYNYARVLRSYVRNTRELLDKLRDVNAENLAEYAVTVHGIKGSSYGIYAVKLGRMAERLEAAAKAGNMTEVLESNPVFLCKTEELLDKLDELLQENGVAGKRQATAPDTALLKEMHAAALHYNVEEMRRIMDELESYSYVAGGDLVIWLREQTENLEYDVIAERLQKFVTGRES
jgi:signal transduction histidine kinase/CheY-like chemotaxis protein/HPt (histidine-containing phosphotransfer) domain-containing protein